MTVTRSIRWGILGTADIAEHRSCRRCAQRWATEHGVGHGVEGYVTEQSAAPDGEPSFTPAIRRVLRGLDPPRHLAVDEAMGNATAIAALLAAARS